MRSLLRCLRKIGNAPEVPDGHRGRVPFVPDVRRGNKRDGRLFVFMPHGLQQFFAFVLSDFAAAFFSQIAHVEDSWLKVG